MMLGKYKRLRKAIDEEDDIAIQYLESLFLEMSLQYLDYFKWVYLNIHLNNWKCLIYLYIPNFTNKLFKEALEWYFIFVNRWSLE